MPYEWTLLDEDLESHSANSRTLQASDSVTERFPENKIYVDLSHKHNANNLHLMITAACSFKYVNNVKALNRQNGDRSNSTPISLEEDKIYYKHMNDAIVSYSHVVHNLFASHSDTRIINQHSFGIYTRENVERQCGLIWN
ncbi:hypothetical protein QTP88_027516 [Uroleucon formosanum]